MGPETNVTYWVLFQGSCDPRRYPPGEVRRKAASASAPRKRIGPKMSMDRFPSPSKAEKRRTEESDEEYAANCDAPRGLGYIS